MCNAQVADHWETIVQGTGTWKYLVPAAQPDSDWNAVNYVDTAWNSGNGSIGYGDGDDSTVISPAVSVFMRKQFTVIDTSKILDVILHVDYDDGFVAYLNGVEIARQNLGTPGQVNAFNQPADGMHEALLYQGISPPYYFIAKQLLSPGVNVLSAEVHNESLGSSDLTAFLNLSVAVSDTTFSYDTVPGWFYGPLISSNLPIISINTLGQMIPDDPRIVVQMGIIDNGTGMINHVTDPFNNYNGLVNIEVRGSSSQNFPKLSYSFETQDTSNAELDVSLLGLPAESDWVLYAPYNDKSLMRDALAYKMARDMARYATRTVYAELLLNGDYQGIYVLEEKIKRDANRVDIAKLTPADTTGDDLTGGYIIKIDKATAGGGYWTSAYPPYTGAWQTIEFRYHYPDSEDMMPQQKAYIQNFMYEMETALKDTNFTDPDSGYRHYLDPASFIDYFIVNEVTLNVDAYRLSTYFYKDKDSNGGLLKMGPIWDYNISMGNANYCQGILTFLWSYQFNSYCGSDDWQVPFWWERLLQDSLFANELKCRWLSLRQSTLNTSYLLNYIDSVAMALDESKERNFQRWPILGVYVWPNYYYFNTYQEEVDWLKTWLTDRLNWLDQNMPGNCNTVSSETTIPDSENMNVYPNPLSDGAVISFTQIKTEHVSITITDITGRSILTLYDSELSAGNHRLKWNMKDNNGANVKAGIYFLQKYSGSSYAIKKLSVIK